MYDELKKDHQGVAMVVDEYGGIEGMITSEDIYEQLIGDLSDEFDQDLWTISRISENHWRVNAQIPLKELNEHFSLSLEDVASDSLGGLLAERLERIPNVGDKVRIENITFVVLSMNNNRVLDVDLFEKGPHSE